VAFTRTYTYDYLNRLSTMSSPSDPSGCYGLSWTYDRYGNRTAQTETSGTTCPQPSTPASTSTNQLNGTGISYDSAGNMTNDSVHSYTYNASNQLTAVDSGSTSTATYTVEGWRSNKTMGSNLRDYARARSGQVLSEMITSSSGGWDSAYIYLGNQLVAEYTGGSSGTTYFIHQDHLGNTRAVTAMNGNEYDWLDYYPFGEQAEGSTPTTQKFTGYQRDAEDGTANGTDYAMARKYAYSQGRLMSADPLAGDIGNPQSLNRYSYVLNSPLDAIDPTGMSCHWDDGTIDDPPPAGGDGPDQCAQDGGTYWADDPNGLPPPLITQFVWAAMPNNLPAPLIIQFVWAPMPTDDLSDLTIGSSGPIAFAGIGGSFLRGTQNAAAQALKQLAQDAGKTPFTKTPAPSLQPAGEAAPELEWENLAIKRLLALLSDWKITGIGDIPFMIDPLHGNYCAINYGNGCGAIQY
jgi:RHS repeat-associated protein